MRETLSSSSNRPMVFQAAHRDVLFYFTISYDHALFLTMLSRLSLAVAPLSSLFTIARLSPRTTLIAQLSAAAPLCSVLQLLYSPVRLCCPSPVRFMSLSNRFCCRPVCRSEPGALLSLPSLSLSLRLLLSRLPTCSFFRFPLFPVIVMSSLSLVFL
jgi:hypothetical protein